MVQLYDTKTGLLITPSKKRVNNFEEKLIGPIHEIPSVMKNRIEI